MEVRIGICRTDFCRKESDNFRFIEGIEYVTSKRQYDTDAGSRKGLPQGVEKKEE